MDFHCTPNILDTVVKYDSPDWRCPRYCQRESITLLNTALILPCHVALLLSSGHCVQHQLAVPHMYMHRHWLGRGRHCTDFNPPVCLIVIKIWVLINH